jgi:DNA repair exonuclease SbcCD nuclease subunit
MVYWQQKGYPDCADRILTALSAWIERDGNIDFVLHGGDIVDSGSAENIARAAEAFRLPAPVFLCLGNHDLTESTSKDCWMSRASHLFNGGPDYTIERPDCLVHVLATHWGEEPYVWRDRQEEHFSQEQLKRVQAAMDAHQEQIHILVTHSPVLGVPTEQTGFDEPMHAPSEAFPDSVLPLVRDNPQIACVLGAHSHLNMNVEVAGVNFVTVSAFVEAPFEFKLLEVSADIVAMSTIPLAPLLDFRADYDFGKTYVQGRPIDRAFRRHL